MATENIYINKKFNICKHTKLPKPTKPLDSKLNNYNNKTFKRPPTRRRPEDYAHMNNSNRSCICKEGHNKSSKKKQPEFKFRNCSDDKTSLNTVNKPQRRNHLDSTEGPYVKKEKKYVTYNDSENSVKCDCKPFEEEENHTTKESDYWKLENDPTDLNAASDGYNGCECFGNTVVRKTLSKINWHNRPAKSRYHQNCTPGIPKPKMRKKYIRFPTLISKPYDDVTAQESNESRNFKNECYCVNQPQKPLMSFKTPAASHCKRQEKFCECPPIIEKFNCSMSTLRLAKDVLDYTPESEFLKKIKKDVEESFVCNCGRCMHLKQNKSLKHTRRRELIEKDYSDLEEDRQDDNYYEEDDIEKADKACMCNAIKLDKACTCNTTALDKGCSCSKAVFDKCMNTIRNAVDKSIATSKNLESKKIGTNMTAKQGTKIQKTKNIRQKNFFETHSTADLQNKNKPNHRCIHKFQLDKRQLPKPLNADVYGTSKCVTCNKAMNTEARKLSVTFGDSPKIQSNASSSTCNKISSTRPQTTPSTQSSISIQLPSSNSSKCYTFRTTTAIRPVKKNVSKTCKDDCADNCTTKSPTNIAATNAANNAAKYVNCMLNCATNCMENKYTYRDAKLRSCMGKCAKYTCTNTNCNCNIRTHGNARPRTINLGTSNHDIQLNLNNSGLFHGTKHPCSRPCRPCTVPTNSCALRYQKGVV